MITSFDFVLVTDHGSFFFFFFSIILPFLTMPSPARVHSLITKKPMKSNITSIKSKVSSVRAVFTVFRSFFSPPVKVEFKPLKVVFQMPSDLILIQVSHSVASRDLVVSVL